MRTLQKLLIILFVIAFFNDTQAGELKEKGVRGGLVFSNSFGSNFFADPAFKSGLSGGIFTAVSLSKNIALQPEFMYIMKGFKVSDQTLSSSSTLHFLELPVLLKYYTGSTTGFRPNFVAGPFFSYFMSGNIEVTNRNFTFSEKVENMKQFDIGLLLGTSIDFALANNNMQMDIRYSVGLVNWHKDLSGFHHHVISFLLGISF